MTRLLVSVRDTIEARAALAAGADLIDVKEPSRGPLGAADQATIAAVVEAVAGRAPTSAALGELIEGLTLSGEAARGVDFVKFGLAGCHGRIDWQTALARRVAELGASTAGVAVVYADEGAAGAPEAESIIGHAAAAGCRAVLFDTFDKQAAPVGAYLGRGRLAALLAEARRRGLASVVAGGLKIDDLEWVSGLGPDYVGVRGGVCTLGRQSTLDRDKVAQWVERLAKWRAARGFDCAPLRTITR